MFALFFRRKVQKKKLNLFLCWINQKHSTSEKHTLFLFAKQKKQSLLLSQKNSFFSVNFSIVDICKQFLSQSSKCTTLFSQSKNQVDTPEIFVCIEKYVYFSFRSKTCTLKYGKYKWNNFLTSLNLLNQMKIIWKMVRDRKLFIVVWILNENLYILFDKKSAQWQRWERIYTHSGKTLTAPPSVEQTDTMCAIFYACPDFNQITLRILNNNSETFISHTQHSTLYQ